MKKRISKAFGKKVYLLGIDIYGEYIWLEEPTWDCGWYWGFGYVETYTNHRFPDRSKDITCHTHWDSIHKKHENPFKKTVFSEKEYIRLKELFTLFYQEKDIAESLKRYHPDKVKIINEVSIPKITKEIIEILTPENNEK